MRIQVRLQIFLTLFWVLSSSLAWAEDVSIDKCRTKENGQTQIVEIKNVEASDLLKITPQNFESYRKSIITLGKSYLSSESKEFKLGDRYEVSPKLPKFMFLRKTSDGIYEMRGFGADSRFFKAKRVDGKIEWMGVEKPENPNWVESLPLQSDPIRIQNVDALKMNREELIRRMAAHAGEASRTVQNKQALANDERAKAAAEGLVKAAEYVVKMAEQKQTLTLKKLEELHALVANGTIQTKNGDLGLGILRGSAIRCVKSGSRYVLADMSKTSVRMGEQMVMSYTAPQDVAPTLQTLIDRINKLSPKSSAAELADIYTQFISTHPFIDGNGRTSRMLVQYMQLKMQVKITALNEDAAFQAFYLKPEELSHLIFKKTETTAPSLRTTPTALPANSVN